MRPVSPARRVFRPRAASATLALAACLGLLAGCGGSTARTLGLTRDAPDEFQVTTRAPLSMPPSLGALPTPRPGAARPQELSQREQAEGALVPAAVLGGAPRGTRPSGAEGALVSQAARASGAAAAPDIRRRVDEESVRLERPDRTVVDRLMFWRETPPPGTTVDATREARRLRENAALGREATEGETAIIQRAPAGRGLLGGLGALF